MKMILRYLKISVLASAVLGVVGAVLSLFFKAPLLQGAYMAIMIGACIPMLGAILTFAAPSLRIKYMTHEIDEKTKGAESLPFALAGIVMMGIAFFVEALMH